MKRDSFIFYRSFYEAISQLGEGDRLAVYEALCRYALDGSSTAVEGVTGAMLSLMRPQIDANNERYLNGKKGGRPKTKAKPRQNHPEPTDNPNENSDDSLDASDGEEPEPGSARQAGGSRDPFDRSILEKQIAKACHKQGIADCSDFVEIITFYYGAYMRTFHREHPRLSAKAMDGVISALCNGSEMVEDIYPETYKAMIERHFRAQYQDCDYNICHFMSEGIRNNRYYESCY